MATDAEIRAKGIKFLPLQKYLQNPYEFPVEEETAPVPGGITNTNAFTNSGGNNDFNRSFSNNPYTAQPSGSFVTNRTGYGTSGYLSGTEPEETFMDKAGGLIKKGIGMAIPGGNFLMGMAGKLDNFKNLSAQDKAFIEMQMGNQEQSVHGGNLPNQDRYGYNKRSAFGNYNNVITDRVEIANARIAEGKELRDIDKYYLEKEKEKEDVNKQVDFNNFVRQRGIANKIREGIKKGTIDEGFNIHNNAGIERAKKGQAPSDPGSRGRDDTPGFGKTAAGNYTNQFEGGDPGLSGGTTGGFDTGGGKEMMARGGRAGYFFGGRVNYKIGGRVGFKNGGLASIL